MAALSPFWTRRGKCAPGESYLHESVSRLWAEEPEDRVTDITAYRTSRFSTSDLPTDANICGISAVLQIGI
jgi:hypothetical protein